MSETVRLARLLLKKFLACLLLELHHRPPEPVTVREDDGVCWARVTLAPLSADDDTEDLTPLPGRHLSDRGQRLFDLLKEKGPMSRLAAGKALGWADKHAKCLNGTDLGCIQDMLDRGVIVDHQDGEGIQVPS